MLKVRCVTSDPIEDADGLRILVTRFRGRGLPADRYHVWMPSLGPSETLLRRVQTGEIPWAAFKREYTGELFADGAVDESNETIKNHGQKFTLRLLKTLSQMQDVTLMCHCGDDEPQCHRHVLKALIESSKV